MLNRNALFIVFSERNHLHIMDGQKNSFNHDLDHQNRDDMNTLLT
jgi:hypothetical protein